jgi:gluconate 2-dehydrogenase gamma chain
VQASAGAPSQMPRRISRRELLKAAALVPAAAVAVPIDFVPRSQPFSGGSSPVPSIPGPAFLSDAERAFVESAVARLIPADDLGPGAKEAGVAEFIDRQLAGPFGGAETWYMQGPWSKGTDEQGYQLRLSPAQLYRAAIADIDERAKAAHGGKRFADLDAAAQDALLHALEGGDASAGGDLAKDFFTMLLANTTEGFLADPIYGGNRDFIGWKLVGFPGPRYNYVAEIEQHGRKYEMPTVGLAGRDATDAKG